MDDSVIDLCDSDDDNNKKKAVYESDSSSSSSSSDEELWNAGKYNLPPYTLSVKVNHNYYPLIYLYTLSYTNLVLYILFIC